MIKSELDREYTQHINSDGNLPNVPEDKFMQKREVTVDSFSETISSDSSSDDRTITADPEESTSSMEDNIENNTCVKKTDSTDIEASLYQIVSGLQKAAEGYMSLASHISKLNPYEIPQVIAQIPPPPIDVPIPIRKALTVDGESKTVNYLLCGEYEMTNTSCSKLQKKYNISKNKIYSGLKGKTRPGGSQYWQKRKRNVKPMPTTSHTNTETD